MTEFKVGDKVIHAGHSAVVVEIFSPHIVEVHCIASGATYYAGSETLIKLEKGTNDMNFVNLDLTDAELFILKEFMGCFGTGLFDKTYKELPSLEVQNTHASEMLEICLAGLDTDSITEFGRRAVSLRKTVEINGKTYYMDEVEEALDGMEL